MENFDFSQPVDPTKVSPVPESIKFEENPPKRYKDAIVDLENRDLYFPLKRASQPDIQHFVGLLSKGILHVSDVVEKDGTYYSKKEHLEEVAPGKEKELEAEGFLLNYLFGDWDKEFISEKDQKFWSNVNNAPEGVEYHQNFIKDNEGRFIHYDYGYAAMPHNEQRPFEFGKDLKDMDIALVNSEIPLLVKGMTGKEVPPAEAETIKNRIREKIVLFEKHLSNKDFFDAIIKKSKLNLEYEDFGFLKGNSYEEKAESLRAYLTERIDILNKALN